MTRKTGRLRMQTLLALGCVTVLTAGTAAVASPANAAPDRAAAQDGTIPGAWIVTLVDGQSPGRVADDHRRNEGAQVEHVYSHALRGYAARMSETAAARIARDDRVLAVEPDRVVEAAGPKGDGKPGGSTKPGSTTPEQPVQDAPTGVLRIGNPSATGVGVDVAVLDTGIDLDHPDLNVVGAKNCIGRGNGDDGNGHGTHVAGSIGAKDNSIGVVGVAPGVNLWAVRVLDNRGSGTQSSVLCGIDWVRSQKAAGTAIEVVNMSLSGTGSDPADGVVGDCKTGNSYHDAICSTVAGGTTFVVAAGNSSADARSSVPAAYDEVITVSALADFNGLPGGAGASTCRVDVDDSFADFSNYGADIDLIAPGVCIRSTWPGGTYNTISGTSMAAPHVAGAAALHLGINGTNTPAMVQAALLAKGNNNWFGSDDPDENNEPLLDVSTY